MAGMKHSVEWWGKDEVSQEYARTGREGVNHTLGGRRAHGPKVEKNWAKVES